MKFYLVLPFVQAIIQNNKKHVLIGQTANLKRKPYPKWWDLPGGKMEEGETPEECIRRELKEELGVAVTSLKLFGVFHHSGKYIRKECTSKIPGVGLCYKVKVKGKIKPTEQENVQFVDPGEMKKLKLTPWTKYFLSLKS